MAGEPEHEQQHRVRIGLIGLAVVFLLVLFGTAVLRSSENGAPNVVANENAASGEPNEPLAEIGAAPSQGASDNAATERKRAK